MLCYVSYIFCFNVLQSIFSLDLKCYFLIDVMPFLLSIMLLFFVILSVSKDKISKPEVYLEHTFSIIFFALRKRKLNLSLHLKNHLYYFQKYNL